MTWGENATNRETLGQCCNKFATNFVNNKPVREDMSKPRNTKEIEIRPKMTRARVKPGKNDERLIYLLIPTCFEAL